MEGAVASRAPETADEEAGRLPEIDRSVARIVNYRQEPDWYSPWDLLPVREAWGSGFVIAGGWIMTNAHVVSDARMLLFYLHGDPTPHEAQVLAVGHDCDLALLEPLEEGLLADHPSLPFGELPRLRSVVETYGYPAGGSQISSTRGVVSRIEMQYYTHPWNERHLAVQTDAAINPGNSGGPVVQDGKVVGVAFQAAAGLENVGFFIPPQVIHHFLTDVRSGTYKGFPALGVVRVSMENAAARRKAGMVPGEPGVAIDLVYPGGCAQGLLEVGDILLAIDGQRIANDGTVALGDLRTDVELLIDGHQVGDPLTLQVLHRGERRELSVTLGTLPAAARFGNLYDRLPRYYVHGGLVFVPLYLETMKTFGWDWRWKADKALLHEFLFRPLAEPAQYTRERVVLLRRLDHPVNVNMAWFNNLAVERVNGRAVGSLEELIAAIEEHTGRHHLLEFSNYGCFGVIDREAAEQANAEILEQYGVAKDRHL